jgi:TonB family protein
MGAIQKAFIVGWNIGRLLSFRDEIPRMLPASNRRAPRAPITPVSRIAGRTWSKLFEMGPTFLAICGFIFAFAVSSATKCRPQTDFLNHPQGDVILLKLNQPIYPPLARQVRIVGDVEVEVEVNRDGIVQKVVSLRGHPLLLQAAIDSAKHSQFQCRDCGEASDSIRIIYTFQLAQPDTGCSASRPEDSNGQENQVFPRVIQSDAHVTVIDRSPYECQPSGPVEPVRKVRSWKCFYLWRCSNPRLISVE